MTGDDRSEEGAEEAIEDLEAPASALGAVAGGVGCPGTETTTYCFPPSCTNNDDSLNRISRGGCPGSCRTDRGASWNLQAHDALVSAATSGLCAAKIIRRDRDDVVVNG